MSRHSIHFEAQIRKLKEMMLSLGSLAEESVRNSLTALKERDTVLAVRVINGDEKIDQMEVELEEECLKTLALHQPVANDLRLVISVLKINNDLERVGDLCSNICRYLKKTIKIGPTEVPEKLKDMFPKVLNMMNLTIDCAYKDDIETVIQVCDLDNEIDKLNKALLEELKLKIKENPEMTDQLLFYFSISRTLERIADYFTNICEDIYYKVTGEIVRHNPENMTLEDED